jgi:L-asparagine transporter-like permease
MRLDFFDVDYDKLKAMAPGQASEYLRESIGIFREERKNSLFFLAMLGILFFINTFITLFFRETALYFAIISILLLLLMLWFVFLFNRYNRNLKNAYEAHIRMLTEKP